ncbi:HAD hydrolase-like protein [Candidatus Nomurabacteria bacterium]|nr:HAD hydrolase-like protein [Candidatus Nomurabacteria bacterium]
MKFIFDFDDVLFQTKKFIEHEYVYLVKIGISRSVAEEFYKKTRGGEFSLKNFISNLFNQEKIKEVKAKDVYEHIINKSSDFVNKELLKIVQKLRKENCYLVTYGYEEFQIDKIKKAGIESFFSEIIVVSESKKEAVEKICAKHKDETVIFVDDKAKHFEDLDFQKCPNLKTILYDEKGLEKLKVETKK